METIETIEVKMFSRLELVELARRAAIMARIPGAKPHWVRAYEQLVDAADRIHAMTLRCIVPEPPYVEDARSPTYE